MITKNLYQVTAVEKQGFLHAAKIREETEFDAIEKWRKDAIKNGMTKEKIASMKFHATLIKEGQMAKVLFVVVETLEANTSKGIQITEASQLGTTFSITQLNALAVKYLGKEFPKGTKKSDACDQLFTAMSDAVGIKAGKAPKAPVAAPAAPASAPVADTVEDSTPAYKPKKQAKAPKATEAPAEEKVKAPKKPREPKAPRTYVFVSPGKAVTAETIQHEGKPLSPQGKFLYTTFVGGLEKGKKVEFTKEEILAKLAEYPSKGNVWNNFMWYRMVFKKMGIME